MKVFSCPDEVKYEQLIWNSSNFGSMKEFNEKRNEENKKHQEKLKQWLIDSGYNGENTGKVYNHQVGDGYASYMFADGKTSCLIHLPYDDEYHSPDVKYISKKEILKRIKSDEEFKKLFEQGKKDES